MAVRNFAGSTNVIRCALGSLTGAHQGAVTAAVLAKMANDGVWQPYLGIEGTTGTGTTICRTWWRSDGNSVYWENWQSGYVEATSALSITTSEGWCILAWTKASGSDTPRAHKCVLSTGVWTHADMSGTVGDSTTTAGNVKIGRSSDSSDSLQGRLALAAMWKAELSDGDVETLADGLAAWLAVEAAGAIWPLTQEATSTPVEDITGGGADQSALAGTTVVTGDDPPNFSFDPGGDPAEATAAIDLGLAVTATTRATRQVSASIPLGLAVTAQTQATHNVAAAVPLGLELAATSEAPEVPAAEVTAAVPLSVDVTATARATHQVSADVPLTTALAGTTDAPPVADAEVTTSIPLGLAVAAAAVAEHTVTAGVTLALAVTATADAPEIVVPGAVTAQIPLALTATSSTAAARRVSAAVPLILTMPAVVATGRAVTVAVPLALQLTAVAQAEDPFSPGTATEVLAHTPTATAAAPQTPAAAASAARAPTSTAVAALVPTAGGVT